MGTKKNKSEKYFHDNLPSEQITRINEIIDIFVSDSTQELEVSFKNINYSNYVRIMRYYADTTDESMISGYTSLDINLVMKGGNTLRVTLSDETELSKFISTYSNSTRDHIIDNLSKLKPSSKIQLMLKNRADRVDLFMEEYDAYLKSTEETPIDDIRSSIDTKSVENILYRYKTRISFAIDTTAKLDITEVNASKRLSDLLSAPTIHEIELEFVDHKIKNTMFYEVLYDVLKIMQDSSLPISRTEANNVIAAYKKLLKTGDAYTLDMRSAISLESQHIIKFIPNRYAITDKADGERYFVILLESGIYLISTNLVVRKTDIQLADSAYIDTILDGELIKILNHNVFMAFDVVYHNKTDYRNDDTYTLPVRKKVLDEVIDKGFGTYIHIEDYSEKHSEMELGKIRSYYTTELKKYWTKMTERITKCKTHDFITRKDYLIPYGIDCAEVFMYADLVWKLYVYNKIVPYKLDGIIYTPINAPYMIKVNYSDLDAYPLEYKWKQPSLNSIDFYIRFVKDENGKDVVIYDDADSRDTTTTTTTTTTTVDGGGVGYKVCTLFVGQNRGSTESPIPFRVDGINQQAYLPLTDGEARDNEGDLINDGTVVEFTYDISKTDIDNMYKWIPLRTRYDKTESVAKYSKKYGNNLNIAIRIWKTIVNPVTENIIMSLSNPATYAREIEKLSKPSSTKSVAPYYQKRTNDAAGMRAFNNWIKSNMINTYCQNKESVLDIGCGRGGDLLKFINASIKEYVGTDIDNDGMYTIKESAISRYKKFKKTMRNVPDMKFINVDSRGLFNVSAQEAILPSMVPANKKLIETYLNGNKKYSVINCQFSMHYYISDEISWSNFMTNLKNHLEDNGYFLVTCFDGEFLYNRLKGKNKMTVTYTDPKGNKKTFFEITKMYDDAEYDGNKIGMGIDLYNSTISERVEREYLVFADELEKNMKENCGMELVETDTFYSLFNLYKHYFTSNIDAKASNKKTEEIRKFYHMLDPEYHDQYTSEQIDYTSASFKFSMLYRYFVFKKVTKLDVTQPSRVVGINYKINVGRVLMPHFEANKIVIDPTRKTNKINKIYHAIRKSYPKSKPSVYLIRHTTPTENIDKHTFSRNKFEYSKIKEGDDHKILLLYKSPEKEFYPIYQQTPKQNKYLFSSNKFMSELDFMVELSNKYHQ